MDYIEYILVGALVAAAAGYAVYRIRRAFQGKDGCGCPFAGAGVPSCQHCSEKLEEKEADGERGSG